mgnify:CR=1 FL=1
MGTATFELIEFNTRRLARGVEAARVSYEVDGDCGWLWMSRRDVEKNIREFGESPGLLAARDAYDIGSLPANAQGERRP